MELRAETLGNLAHQESVPAPDDPEARAAFDSFMDLVAFNLKKADTFIARWSGPLINESVDLGWKQVHADLGFDSDFTVKNPVALDFAEHRKNLMPDINARIHGHIREQLRLGVNKGETLGELSQRLKSNVFKPSMSRARTIARTETMTAVNGGRASAMKKLDVEKIEWISARDEQVRVPPISIYNHLIDGEVVEMGEEFSLGLRWPHDDGASRSEPGNVINCRCTMIPVV